MFSPRTGVLVAALTAVFLSTVWLGPAVAQERVPLATFDGHVNPDITNTHEGFGNSVAGEANAGGLASDFLLVGAQGYDRYVPGSPPTQLLGAGRAYLYVGDLLSSGHAEIAIQPITGFAQDQFGASVAMVTDPNGALYPYLIIGVPGHDAQGILNSGGVWVSYGGNPTFGTILNPSSGAGAAFGSAVFDLGAFDEDGYGDMAVSAPTPDVGPARVYVYLGSSGQTGPTSLAAYYSQEQTDDGFGAGEINLAGGADLLGSAHSDLIVGAPDFDDGAITNAGRVYIFTGADKADLQNVTAGSIDGTRHPAYITGEDGNEQLGSSVGVLGDINGDGLEDFGVVSTIAATSSLWVVLGGTPLSGAVTRSSAASYRIDGVNKTARIERLGDVNNDGFDDFALGNPFQTIKNTTKVFYGGDRYASGSSSLQVYTAPNLVIDEFRSELQWDELGFSVAAIGDINEDGLADLAVGAPGFHNGSGETIGRTYIYDSSLVFRDDTSGSGLWGAAHTPFALASLNRDEGAGSAADKGVDVFVTYVDQSGQFFDNDGEGAAGELKFVEVTNLAFDPDEMPASGLRGSAVADADNNGFEDMFVADGSSPKLYLNTGASGSYRFDDKLSSAAGTGTISMPGTNQSWAAAWGDYDRDGWVDLFVVRAGGTQTPGGITGAQDKLFRSTAQQGLGFDDVTADPGMGLETADTKSSSATWADVDADGNLDLYVTSLDAGGAGGEYGKFYLNMGDGTFEDRTQQATGPSIGSIAYATGTRWTDLDRDGYLDIVVSRVDPSTSTENIMTCTNDGTGRLVNESFGVDVADEMIGVVPVDFDLNGVVDVMGIPESGSAAPPLYAGYWPPSGSVNYLPRNGAFGVQEGASQGIAVYDHDADGDLDFVRGRYSAAGDPDGIAMETRRGGTGANDSKPAASWLAVDLKALESGGNNRAAIGSMIKVRFPATGEPHYTAVRTVSGAGGRFGHMSRVQHFGFGERIKPAKVTVTWPDGFEQSQIVEVGELNSTLEVVEELHAPEITQNTLQFQLQPKPGQKVDWVISWTTQYNSDPSQLSIRVSDVSKNGPLCYDPPTDPGQSYLTLDSTKAGVQVSVTPVPGGGIGMRFGG